MSDFTVMTSELQDRLFRLNEFYREVARLTVKHDVIIKKGTSHGVASVSPKTLGEALSKVDPKWFENSY